MRWSFSSVDAVGAFNVRCDLMAYLESRATPGSDFAAAALIFGELVGNVVRHAPGPISVDVEWANDTAVLRVRDRGPGFEWSGAAALPDAMSESGRGLYIVKSLARDLQVRSVDGSGTEAVAWLPVSLNPQLRAG